MSEEPSFFIGVDPSDPYAENKRPCARAILRPDLHCEFDYWQYARTGAAIVPPDKAQFPYILAVDGPQGLAGTPGQEMRVCDQCLGTAGKSPYDLPDIKDPYKRPYSGFVRGSIELFYSLHKSGFYLLGIQKAELLHTNLIEVYPGRAWLELFNHLEKLLEKKILEKKRSPEGRRQRYMLLSNQGVVFDPKHSFDKPPTHDELDAAMAAYIAFLFKHEKTHNYGRDPYEDASLGVLREGLIVQPSFYV